MEEKDKTPGSLVPDSLPKELQDGKTLVQTKVPYVTAVKVQIERSLDKIVESVEKEAEFAGHTFYYNWELGGEKSRGKKVEGGSIGLAAALVRLWGNCAVPILLEETDETWIFTASFIDLETGFNLQRIYRYRKDRLIAGRYDAARSEDMAFQSAQSRAIRNVVLTAMPKWLVETAINKSKQAEMKKITYEGLAKAAEDAIKFFEGYGVKEQNLISRVGKQKSDWTSEDIADLRGLAQAVKDGQIKTDDLITLPEPEKTTNVSEILSAKPTKTGEKK